MSIRRFEDITPQIDPSAYLDSLSLVLGRVKIAAQASLWPYAVARGDVQSIEIGARTNVQDHAMLHVTHDGRYSPGGRALVIGDAVTIGHHATLHACTIEHHCLIGIGAVVLDGAHLESYVLLAAGSLVPPNKRLCGGYLWRGNPVQQARPLTEQEREFFDYSANQYVLLAQRHQQASVVISRDAAAHGV
ncbi:gamma carbonic anhydrase family protein [Thioflexithrix psekupsensis]|uniref:Gamma carbonic anhydrase family protein n=1 Tax=Thioflexithrix psekupsensis TaxID=1570016 RepID=A0A251X6J8_9GAMM|nr:gamma carbonic anhydrase family protein [Thioflexithrix psekupsensis]OUD13242.1 gamma carbonic anhydrase family protein [Thioflexithrix psekupsensis]